LNQVITIVTKDKLSTLKKTITTISNIINEDGKVQKYVSLSLSAMDIMFICEKKSINKIKRNIYKYLKNYPVDFYIQNQTNRKKKLLACDMDMTILTFESINRMANKAGIYKNIEKETKKAVSGKSNFSDSIIKRTKMFKGYHKDICLKIFENKNCFTPGSKILINTMRAHKNITILISGGYSIVAEYAAFILGFDQVHANKLILTKNIINGELEKEIIDCKAKKKILIQKASELDVSLSDTIAIGDGANDIEMLEIAGLGIGWRPQEIVKNYSKANIHYTDLKTVLYFQGYKEKEFIY